MLIITETLPAANLTDLPRVRFQAGLQGFALDLAHGPAWSEHDSHALAASVALVKLARPGRAAPLGSLTDGRRVFTVVPAQHLLPPARITEV